MDISNNRVSTGITDNIGINFKLSYLRKVCRQLADPLKTGSNRIEINLLVPGLALKHGIRTG